MSGYGFELTFRLAGDVTKDPPVWPIGFLQNLARYVFRTGNVFRPDEYLPLNGPITIDEPTLITDVIFAVDPEALSDRLPLWVTGIDLLPLRLPYDKPYAVSGPKARVTFRPADANAVTNDGPELTVTLTTETLRELLTQVVPRRGSYALPSWPGLVIHVLPSEITDPDGRVVEVIG